jgi:hypothetical protein
MPGKGDPNFDKLFRIRPEIDSLLKASKENNAQTREQAIYECMVNIRRNVTNFVICNSEGNNNFIVAVIFIIPIFFNFLTT